MLKSIDTPDCKNIAGVPPGCTHAGAAMRMIDDASRTPHQIGWIDAPVRCVL